MIRCVTNKYDIVFIERWANMSNSIEAQIRDYIVTNLMFGDTTIEFDDNSSLLELGIVDSAGVMELVLFVEETFDLEIGDDEIVPDNFDSISQLSSYIQAKLNTV